jgi:hypothetical protein
LSHVSKPGTKATSPPYTFKLKENEGCSTKETCTQAARVSSPSQQRQQRSLLKLGRHVGRLRSNQCATCAAAAMGMSSMSGLSTILMRPLAMMSCTAHWTCTPQAASAQRMPHQTPLQRPQFACPRRFQIYLQQPGHQAAQQQLKYKKKKQCEFERQAAKPPSHSIKQNCLNSQAIELPSHSSNVPRKHCESERPGATPPIEGHYRCDSKVCQHCSLLEWELLFDALHSSKCLECFD